MKFAEQCQNGLVAPEMERDLLQVEDSALAEATSFLLASVSGFRPLYTFVCLGLFCADKITLIPCPEQQPLSPERGSSPKA